jgi:hypothetical protein
MLTVNKSRWYNLLTMIRSGLLYAAIILLLLCTVMPTAATSIVSSENDLQQSVIALDRARHRAVHDLAEKKQNAALEEKHQQDYEKFIIFLTIRIGEYCQQLRTEAGEAAVADLPCPEEDQSFMAVQSGSAQTSKEQVGELERLFADSLGEFDEKLLKEEETLAARQPSDRETGYGYGGSQGRDSGGKTAGTGQTSGQGSGSSQSTGSEGTAGQGSEEGGPGVAQTGEQTGGSATDSGEETGTGSGKGTGSGEGAGPSVEGGGAGQSAGSGTQPGKEELETGDDDIVARQLREAAEKETDPELKKRLWEEYRKYKEGAR